jgi:hypothetical protein
VLAEIGRVLAPGGVMYHNVCTAANTRHGLWCAVLLARGLFSSPPSR